MKKFSTLSVALLATLFAVSANADPIEVTALPGGAHPTHLGGYELTPFGEPSGIDDCTASPSGGEVCFEDYYGNSIDLPAETPWWWEYPEHGNVFVVRGENWIDLILPANTRAFSFFVGASSRSSAWIRAYDDAGNSTPLVDFGLDRNDTRGYGVHTNGCSALTRITVDPFEWGFGHLSSYQGDCTEVPEPAPIALLGLGLLGLALTRRAKVQKQRIA